jgi:L-alanine-DL-glutamate epimerase-like enolase superfamily enzyme
LDGGRFRTGDGTAIRKVRTFIGSTHIWVGMSGEGPDYRIPQGGGVPWRDLSDDESHRAPERDIEITDIKAMALAGNFTWGIISVETDAGYQGIGETYRAPRGMLEYVRGLSVDLVGENPLDTDRIAELLNQNYTATGRFGQGAFTAIETACWDIKGKALGVPVYELLGGKYRDQVQLYCDTHAGEGLGTAEGDESEQYTPESYARAASAVVAEGFDALKFDLDVHHTGDVDTAARRLDNEEIEHKVSLVEAIREEIGYGPDLGVDLHWNFTVETAIRLGRKLEPFDLAWLEDPVPPDRIDAQRRVAERVPVPILTGENAVTDDGFYDLVSAGVMDIAAPDVAKCGGLGEFRKIATVCDLHGIPVAAHNIASPVGTIAGVHASAAIPNFICMEYHAREVPWWGDLVHRTGGSGPIIEDGAIDLPEGPGLGIETDPDVAEAHLARDSELIV